MPELSGQPEPIRGYNFRLDVDGYTGYFTRCSGLGARIQSIAYREGGAGPQIRRLAGPVDYADVTLSYGLIPSVHPSIWLWLESAIKGSPVRKTPSVILLDADGRETMRFNLFGAWPVEWRAANLDALGRDVAIETLTLVYEKIERG